MVWQVIHAYQHPTRTTPCVDPQGVCGRVAGVVGLGMVVAEAGAKEVVALGAKCVQGMLRLEVEGDQRLCALQPKQDVADGVLRNHGD